MTRSFLNEVYLIIISYVVLASFFGIEVGDLLDHHGLIIVRFDLRNWERHQCQSQSRANTPLTVELVRFPNPLAFGKSDGDPVYVEYEL